MKLRVLFSLILFFFLFRGAPVFADILGSGFTTAQGIIQGWRPTSTGGGNGGGNGGNRGGGGSRTEEPAQEQPDPGEIEERRRKAEEEAERLRKEKEKARVQQNLSLINAGLDSAGGGEPGVVVSSNTGHTPVDAAAVTTRWSQIDDLVDAKDAAESLRLSASLKEEARANGQAVRDAVARGEKPPFQALWDYYKYNRPVALGFLPDQNRCAFVLSMALGLEPRTGEKSLHDIASKNWLHRVTKMLDQPVPVDEIEVSKRYYVRAQELADRLSTDFGQPTSLKGQNVSEALAGKKGVLFIQGGYLRGTGSAAGDHIDLWDSDHMAAAKKIPEAKDYWFWELK